MNISDHAAMMLIAMGIDLILGWPNALYRRIGHPVTWLGWLIAAWERRLNKPGTARRAKGIGIAILAIGVTVMAAGLASLLLPEGLLGIFLGGVLAWPLVAMRSMHDHVAAVEQPLSNGDLPGARHAVSMIVGRDPSQLDEAGVARAAIESLAENTSDGITAPIFWGVIGGLPGIAAYKAINTLDSMIGHLNDRYAQFGWASARIDDVANLIPARLTGGLFALVSNRPLQALKTMMQDARHHRSPNAGWPEAAMAGALGIRLSGPRTYGDQVAAEPFVNANAPDPDGRSIRNGLALYSKTMIGIATLLAIIAII